MQHETLKTLMAQALTAMKAGNQIVAKSVGEVRDDVHHPEFKVALEAGAKLRETWAQRIDKALQDAGGQSGEMTNPVLEGIYDIKQKIRRQAPDSASRELGICADGQLALHYWMAAFGTVRNYASKLGMSRTAQAMQASIDEAKRADEAHNAIADHIIDG